MNQHHAVVIEDDPDISLLIAVIIESMGYTVHTAETGPAGIHAVRSARPEMITTDLGLPGLGGLEVITAIRAHSDTPILVISADTDSDTLERARAAGANGFLPKPFRPQALRAYVEKLGIRAVQTDFVNR